MITGDGVDYNNYVFNIASDLNIRGVQNNLSVLYKNMLDEMNNPNNLNYCEHEQILNVKFKTMINHDIDDQEKYMFDYIKLHSYLYYLELDML